MTTVQNKTLQAADGFFNFIFKIGEAIFYYIVVLFEAIGQIGNFGIKNFLIYIVGFFAAIISIFEIIISGLFSTILSPLKKLVLWAAPLLYKLFAEVIRPFFTETSSLSQYITGFVVFLSGTVYYFLYRKNEDEAATAGKTAEAIKILEGIEFGSVWGKIGGVFRTAFKYILIVAYSLFIGLFSMKLLSTAKESYTTIEETSNDLKDLRPILAKVVFVFGLIFVLIPMTLFGWISNFVFGFLGMYSEKMRNFDGPILDENNTVSVILTKFMGYISKVVEFFKYYFDIFYEHFATVKNMTWLSMAYVILSSFVYVGLLYKLYFWGSDPITRAAGENHMYYYLIASYLFFIGPLVYLLLKLPQQSLNGLILMSVAFISMLVMYVSNYYMNYRKSVGMEETPEQESDRNTYNMLFVIYSAIIVFFVNFKILSPSFNTSSSSIFLYTLLNLCFIAALIGYSVSYKIKLTNRLNKAATPPPTPPPPQENGVLTPEMTAPNGAATRF